MARHAAHQIEGETTGPVRPSAAEDPAGKELSPIRPLDPLIMALARAVDRLEGTAD